MPWTKSDVDKHKKGLTDAEKEKWVSIANSVLKDSGDEGKAIRIANAKCCSESLQKVLENMLATFDIGDNNMIDMPHPYSKKDKKKKKKK